MSESTSPPTSKTIARNHNPSPNDVYQDSRTDDLLRLIYLDEFVVFLRVDQQTRRGDGNGWIHRMETRPDFDDQLESGRLTPDPDGEVEAPPADYDSLTSDHVHPEGVEPEVEGEPRRSDGTASIRDTDWDKYASGESSSTGEPEESDPTSSESTSSDQSVSKSADADQDDPNQTDQPDSDTATTEDKREEWSELPNIGAKTEENLYEAGFETVEDIRRADTDKLEAVPYLGPAGIDSLKTTLTD